MESSCLDQRGGLCQGPAGAGLLPLREDEREQRLVARQEQDTELTSKGWSVPQLPARRAGRA